MQTVLIIDDSEADQFYNELIIKEVRGDVEIHKAFDGQEALELLEKTKISPDIILLDINMPRMNGHEFLEAYYAKTDREIPVVIMLTSSDQDKDKEKVKQFKCVKDFIVKPITAEKIPELEKLVSKG